MELEINYKELYLNLAREWIEVCRINESLRKQLDENYEEFYQANSLIAEVNFHLAQKEKKEEMEREGQLREKLEEMALVSEDGYLKLLSDNGAQRVACIIKESYRVYKHLIEKEMSEEHINPYSKLFEYPFTELIKKYVFRYSPAIIDLDAPDTHGNDYSTEESYGMIRREGYDFDTFSRKTGLDLYKFLEFYGK
jgi:hypothetical protein